MRFSIFFIVPFLNSVSYFAEEYDLVNAQCSVLLLAVAQLKRC